jgi:hypothetical protein
MASDVTAEQRRAVASRAYHVCEYCLVHEDDNYFACEVDHIISIKHGGRTELSNLAHACFRCNRHKGTDIASLVPSTGALTRFFDPRSDPWAAHFYLRDVHIEPLTDIGRVTARIFEFNIFERLEQRRILAEIGRYPTIDAFARMKE